MKIAIIGTGAIGLAFAYLFSKNENINIILFSRSNCNTWKHNKVIVNNIQTKTQDLLDTTKYDCVSDYMALRDSEPDIIFVATKTLTNQEIASQLQMVYKDYPKKPRLVLAQNGINNEEYFIDIFQKETIRFVVTLAAELINPLSLQINFINKPFVFGRLDNKKDEIINTFETVFNSLNIPVIVPENILKDVWKKAAINCSINALTAFLHKSIKNTVEVKTNKEIINLILSEFFLVAQKEGIDFSNEEQKDIKNIIFSLGPHKTSMNKNIEMGHTTEIDSLNGAIVTLGLKHNIPTPYNTFITLLIHSFESYKKNTDKIDIPKKNTPIFLKKNINTKNCNEEFLSLKERIESDKFKPLLLSIKESLQLLINKLYAIGGPSTKPFFFSDDASEIGNWGLGNIDENFNYLSSKENINNLTIRELIQAITNFIYERGPRKESGQLLLDYIFTNPNPNAFASERKEFILELLHNSLQLDNIKNKFSFLWSPITVLYPDFVFKRSIFSKVNWKERECNSDTIKLLEPFSEKEVLFLNLYAKNVKFVSGKCHYQKYIANDPISKRRQENNLCSVAGLSGHSLLLLELALLFDINWIHMFIALCISFVPNHHSIPEIFDAARVLNLIHTDGYDNSIESFDQLVQFLEGNPSKQGGKRKTIKRKRHYKKTRRHNNLL